MDKKIIASGKVLVSQTRSANRCTVRTKHTLQALGLGRIGKSKEHTLTPATSGMIKAVHHLVNVTQL